MTPPAPTGSRLDSLRRRRASVYGTGPQLDQAVEICRRLADHGLAATIGYTAMAEEDGRSVADAHLAAFDRLAREDLDCHVSVKLSALAFDPDLFAELDDAAAQSGRVLQIDALGPETVDTTWSLLEQAPRRGRIGTTLPGRWPRTADDAARAARLGLRVRVVKGQWADAAPPGPDPAAGFLRVIDRLCGQCGDIGVATHDVKLLAESLDRLTAAGSPCTAELFFGLPFRAPAATARRLGVPIRVYVPYGRAAAPYGVADVSGNPAVAWWLIQDLLLGKDKMWRSIGRLSPQV
jgi:proline dehydrogenase